MYVPKLSLDDQLAPIIEKLHSMHKIGTCSEHPGIRCFRWAANDWHFDIDSTRMKVWANAIVSHFLYQCTPLIRSLHITCKLRKVTDYNQVPLGSNYFGAKHRLGFLKSTKPAPVAAVPDMSASSAAPSWDGHPYCPSLQSPLQHHYGHSYQPMTLYGNYYTPGFAPLNATAFPPGPTSTAHSDQVQLGQDNQAPAIVPKPFTSALSVSQAAVKAFCDKYDLGDEEREGLRKLGFRIGDALDTVTESEWAISGLAPLHRRHVLSAWNTEQSA
jgi:hypothetical protein